MSQSSQILEDAVKGAVLNQTKRKIGFEKLLPLTEKTLKFLVMKANMNETTDYTAVSKHLGYSTPKLGNVAFGAIGRLRQSLSNTGEFGVIPDITSIVTHRGKKTAGVGAIGHGKLEVLEPEQDKAFSYGKWNEVLSFLDIAPLADPGNSNSQPENLAKWAAKHPIRNTGYGILEPASEADFEIAETIGSVLDHAAGFQSNPRIRKAIEDYAMSWARKFLKKRHYAPRDTHKNKPYDFICVIDGKEVFVEVKGMQGDGMAISLTPREVKHAEENKNSALFIVHSVSVRGRRKPVVSGGVQRFIHPWDISTGILKPRGYVLTLGS